MDQVSAGANPRRERVLRKSLAEDYLREGNWAKAAEAYETLEARLGSTMSSDEQDETRDAGEDDAARQGSSAHDGRSVRAIHRLDNQESAGADRCSRVCGRTPAKLDARPHVAVQPDLALPCKRGGTEGLGRVCDHSHAQGTGDQGARHGDSALHHRRANHAAQHDRLCLRRQGLLLSADPLPGRRRAGLLGHGGHGQRNRDRQQQALRGPGQAGHFGGKN